MWSDNETSEDLLGFKVHADLLADVINDDTVLPITIGVFGDWGSGKSSILKIVQESLKGKDDELKDGVLVMYFNGWVFEGFDDAKAALLESIIKEFEEHKTLGPKIKDKTVKLMKSVKWMRTLGLGFKKVMLPAATAYATGGLSLAPMLLEEFSKINVQDLAQKLTGEGAEKFLEDIIEKKSGEDETVLVRDFRDDFKKMIDKSDIKKLVVIIDDLDRCTADRIIENLEAIKLFLNVEKTAFVIGADPRIVRHAIEHRYHTRGMEATELNKRIVEDYLEKLIQVPYNLPKLSESEVNTYITLLVCKRQLPVEAFDKVLVHFQQFREKDRYSVFGLANVKEVLSGEHQSEIAKSLISITTLVPIITRTLSGNPRQVKRFLNTFTLRKRLALVAKMPSFNEGILAKLMTLEYTDPILFGQLYDWQLQNKGVPEQLKKMEEIAKKEQSLLEIKSELEKDEALKSWGKEQMIRWLQTDPSLSGVDMSDYFWLSRDKVLSTIPGAGLISPVIRTLYQKLDQEALADAVSKKIISEEVAKLPEYDLAGFLDFCSQIVVKNPKKTRGYNIFQLLIDQSIPAADMYYAKTLTTINQKDIPVSVGEGLKRYKENSFVKDFVATLTSSSSPFAKAFNSK
ncbi:MAG: P-loop NTPase fold protein [Chitinophagales bacterium]